MKIGLTLPSFIDNPTTAIEMAVAAEAAGLDGVFVYDHLFRRSSSGERRPALEGVALLGAVAAATNRIAVGSLVMRSWLRPAASLATALATVNRIASGRVRAGIGAGDSESKEENESFGLGFGSFDDRLQRLKESVQAARAANVSVWVGGTSERVIEIASVYADGWNCWGLDLNSFSTQAARLRTESAYSPFEISWGGLAVLAGNDSAATEKAHRFNISSSSSTDVLVGSPAVIVESLNQYRDAGADWVVVGPIDSSNLENTEYLGEVRQLLN